jgi:hypothetical protein
MTTYSSYSATPHRCMSCLWVGGVHAPDCLDIQPVQMPVETMKPQPRVPVWAMACLFWGLVLMAIGSVLRDPVARAVWEMIQG